MCGILGFISDDVQYKAEAFQFMSALIEASQQRGRDASGFAAVVDGEFLTDKHPLPAQDFARVSKAFRNLRGGKSVSMIGHTRASTNGSPHKNKNNHPFHGERYSIVHNGGISSFREIAKQHNFDLNTDCDSELLLHFLESRKNIRDGIIDSFSFLDATSFMAVATLDRNSKRVHIFRNTYSPCVILKVKRWRATIFASTMGIIMKASEMVFGDSHRIWEWSDLAYYNDNDANCPEYSHVVIEPDGSVLEECVVDRIKIDRSHSRAYSYGGGWASDEDIAAYSGGTSTYSKKTVGNNKTQPRCSDCKKFVSDKTINYRAHGDRVCRDCFTKVTEKKTERELAKAQWQCIECFKDLEQSFGDVKEVGAEYVCRECWDSIDHVEIAAKDEEIKTCKACRHLISVESDSERLCPVTLICINCWKNSNSGKNLKYGGVISIYDRAPTVSKGSTKTEPAGLIDMADYESKLWSCIPSDLRGEHNNSPGLCLDAIVKMREPLEDYNMGYGSQHSYVNMNSYTTEELIEYYENMNLERIGAMNDGEYLKFIELIDELLVNT